MPERRLHQMNWGAAISPTDALQVMDVGAFLARASLPISPDNAVAAAGAPDNANLSVADITVILVYEEVTGPRFSLALDFSSAWICCGDATSLRVRGVAQGASGENNHHTTVSSVILIRTRRASQADGSFALPQRELETCFPWSDR